MIAFWVVNKEDIFIFNYQCFNCPSNFFSDIKHLNYNNICGWNLKDLYQKWTIKTTSKDIVTSLSPCTHSSHKVVWFMSRSNNLILSNSCPVCKFPIQRHQSFILDLKVAKDLLECNDHDLILFVWKSMSPSLNSNETNVLN